MAEYRTYNPEPGDAMGGFFRPDWGGLYLTRARITAEQYREIHPMCLDLRKSAEQHLPKLVNAARPFREISSCLSISWRTSSCCSRIEGL